MEKLEFKKDDAILHALSVADARMSCLIEIVGDYSLNLKTDYFLSLVRAIIGQQLSVKAAGTIWGRVVDLCKTSACAVTTEVIVNLPDQDLKNAGLSRPKISYIKDLSEKVITGEIDMKILPTLSNDEIISKLTKVKGIGVWTAEMFLIFSLGRLDVLSLNDLGLKRSIQWLYGLKKTPSERTMKTYGKKWAPYQTVASLYLWEVINRGFIKESPSKLS